MSLSFRRPIAGVRLTPLIPHIRSLHTSHTIYKISETGFKLGNNHGSSSSSSGEGNSSLSAAEQRRLLDDLRKLSQNAQSVTSAETAESILKGNPTSGGMPNSMGLGLGSNIYSSPSSKPRGLVAKATGQGKSWSELKPGQKLARGTQKSYQFSMVVGGFVLVTLIVVALGSELYAPNSPTVIFKDACRRVEDCQEVYDHLLPPLRFNSTPSTDIGSFTSSPSPFTRPTGRRSRSSAAETQAIIADRQDSSTPTSENPHAGQVKLIRFYIEARDRDRDWTYMERARQMCSDGYRRVKDEGVELWEKCVDYVQQLQQEDPNTNTLPHSDSHSQSQSDATPSRPSWLSRTLKSTLSPLVSTFSLSASAPGSSPSLLGKTYEPGTFSTGQVHGEMKFDVESGKWQYRRLYVDIPKSGTIGARRVWIVKSQGDVRR
ncbi:unnamed protein product [Sympodiomycopsis kandeliae]